MPFLPKGPLNIHPNVAILVDAGAFTASLCSLCSSGSSSATITPPSSSPLDHCGLSTTKTTPIQRPLPSESSSHDEPRATEESTRRKRDPAQYTPDLSKFKPNTQPIVGSRTEADGRYPSNHQSNPFTATFTPPSLPLSSLNPGGSKQELGLQGSHLPSDYTILEGVKIEEQAPGRYPSFLPKGHLYIHPNVIIGSRWHQL